MRRGGELERSTYPPEVGEGVECPVDLLIVNRRNMTKGYSIETHATHTNGVAQPPVYQEVALRPSWEATSICTAALGRCMRTVLGQAGGAVIQVVVHEPPRLLLHREVQVST